MKRRIIVCLHLLIIIFLGGCSIKGTYIAEEYSAFNTEKVNIDQITARIIYIGDAGEPSADRREPLLDAVEKQASLLPEKTFLFFLGDNIYPYGLPDKGDPGREEYERRLNEQISIIEKSGTRGVFVAGNHDWDQGRSDGWDKLMNQVRFIEEKNNSDIVFLPHNGCPGPEASDFGDYVRIIFLDTQWWLHRNDKPSPENSNCYPATEEVILQRLDSLLRTAGDRYTIIAMHHPLETFGPHGGFFDWKAHLFPLTELNPLLWLPLPVIGSIYPIARMSGITTQDMSSAVYQHMKDKIEGVISKYNGILVASGHEHSMQVIKGAKNNIYTVSGFGTSVHKANALTYGDDTIFAGLYPGFMQVDILKSGSVYLKVFRADPDYSISIEEFSFPLKK